VSADPLSDVLRAVRLDGAFFYAVEASEPWSVEAVAAKDLTPRILPGAEHLISYHILTAGRCWGGMTGGSPVALEGDVIVFPQGDVHVMSSDPKLRRVPATSGRFLETVTLGEGGQVAATFVCGFLGCDRRPPREPIRGVAGRISPRRQSRPPQSALGCQPNGPESLEEQVLEPGAQPIPG
jgi:cupin